MRRAECLLILAVSLASASRFPLQPVRPAADAWVRFFFHGGTLNRDGKIIPVSLAAGETLGGKAILDAIRAQGIDVDERFQASVYDAEMRGWIAMPPELSFEPSPSDGGEPPRVDVMLNPASEATSDGGSRSHPLALQKPADGFFACGVVGLSNGVNLGTLWRSAYQLGAAQMFVVGSRYEPQSSDVTKSWRNVPLVHHEDWNAFAAAQPRGALWVAVEMGGEPLETFDHPERAIYILGSEDTGLPESVTRACHKTVALPSVRYASFNVAVAGSIVLYDRVAKQQRKEEAAAAGAKEVPND